MVRNQLASMYRSRFRTSQRKGERPVSTTDIYTNRCNPYVIDRMIEVGEQRYRKERRKRYEEDRKRLRSSRAPFSTRPGDLEYFTQRAERERKRAALQARVDAFERGDYQREWDARVRPLYQQRTEHVSRLVFSTRMVGRPAECFFVDPDRCPSCRTMYRFDSVTNLNICSACGNVKEVLFISEDNSCDILVNKDPGTDRAPPAPVTYNYVRSPLYRRFLGQFGANVEQLPPDVTRTLYHYLSNIHLQNSVRCRPTPVANILRAQGLTKWANYSIRITNIFNGVPNPVLSDDLIDRLVQRFDLIFRAATAQKQKLPTFAFVTNILLRLEGENVLARSFVLHKTAVVLRRTYDQVRALVASLPPNDLDWSRMPCF